MSETTRIDLNHPAPRAHLRVQDFAPHGVVLTSSWATRRVAYPMGVRLAHLSYLARLSPNAVSILSLCTGLISTLIAGFFMQNVFWGGVVLLVGLQLAYVLDCADGVLARTTKRCSNFGSIFDKTLDCVSIVLIPGILCIAAPARHELEATWVGPLILFGVTPSLAMAMVIWLKDYVNHGGNKLAVDARSHTPFWYVARIVAFFLDTPVFRLALAVSWMTSTFVYFLIGYGLFSSLALVIYLFKTSRELS